jgi:hypothetical protein
MQSKNRAARDNDLLPVTKVEAAAAAQQLAQRGAPVRNGRASRAAATPPERDYKVYSGTRERPAGTEGTRFESEILAEFYGFVFQTSLVFFDHPAGQRTGKVRSLGEHDEVRSQTRSVSWMQPRLG